MSTCETCAHDRRSKDRTPLLCWECMDVQRLSSGLISFWKPKEEPMSGGMEAAAASAKETSDGSSADYYKLPEGATQLQDLISHRNMNAQIGEIFRACYRMGLVSHSPDIRDVKKIIFYAQAELQRLRRLEQPK